MFCLLCDSQVRVLRESCRDELHKMADGAAAVEVLNEVVQEDVLMKARLGLLLQTWNTGNK